MTETQPDPSTSVPVSDDRLLEVYRQASENGRMYATSRFSNLSAFLTYVSLLTAGIAVLASNTDKAAEIGGVIFTAWIVLSVMGLVMSALFYALERRHHLWWEWYELTKVPELEAMIGISQYPKGVTPRDRSFIGADRFLGLGATDATYWVYRASMLAFGVSTVAGFALLIFGR